MQANDIDNYSEHLSDTREGLVTKRNVGDEDTFKTDSRLYSDTMYRLLLRLKLRACIYELSGQSACQMEVMY